MDIENDISKAKILDINDQCIKKNYTIPQLLR